MFPHLGEVFKDATRALLHQLQDLALTLLHCTKTALRIEICHWKIGRYGYVESLKQLLLALLILFYNIAHAIRSLIISSAEFPITIRDPSLSLRQGGVAYSPRVVAESIPGP